MRSSQLGCWRRETKGSILWFPGTQEDIGAKTILCILWSQGSSQISPWGKETAVPLPCVEHGQYWGAELRKQSWYCCCYLWALCRLDPLFGLPSFHQVIYFLHLPLPSFPTPKSLTANWWIRITQHSPHISSWCWGSCLIVGSGHTISAGMTYSTFYNIQRIENGGQPSRIWV